VKLEQFGHVLLGLGYGGAAEAGRGSGGTAYADRGSYKFEQVESDIFTAAGAKARGGDGVHVEKSPKRMLAETAWRLQQEEAIRAGAITWRET
jgi:hypothetical protein